MWDELINDLVRVAEAEADRAADVAHERWLELAPTESYRDSIVREGRTIKLVGFDVLREQGTKERNISEALLRSPSAKTSKDGGRYIAFPTRSGDFIATSSKSKPWVRKAVPGIGALPKVLDEVDRILRGGE